MKLYELGYSKYHSPKVKDAFGEEIQLKDAVHHGILGMKWGVRRYQNKDGSRTSAGKKREKQLTDDQRAKILKSPTRTYKNKEHFTKEEIEDAMKNMRMDRELRQLSRDEIMIGSSYVQSLLTYTTAAASIAALYKTYSKIKR